MENEDHQLNVIKASIAPGSMLDEATYIVLTGQPEQEE